MKTDLYTPFVEATRNVFQLMLDLSDVSEQPAKNFSTENSLNIAIGVIGDLSGKVIYRFPADTSVNMVKIMSGMEFDRVDDFVTSAISEIANIISGNVLTILSGSDLTCDILPPSIIMEDNENTDSIQTTCCFTTSAGDVCLDIRLNPA